MRKCLKCGSELPEDSIFCQYCGSDDVCDIVDVKKCNKCGQELPEDSNFCPYCGNNLLMSSNQESKINEEDKTSKINNTQEDNNIEKKKDKAASKNKNVILYLCYGVIIILLCIICYMAKDYSSMKYDYNVLSNEYNTLSNKYNASQAVLENTTKLKETYYKESKLFSEIKDALANKQIKTSFSADYYFLKAPKSKKVRVRVEGYCEIYSQIYGNGIESEWGSWEGDYATIYISTTSKDAKGYVLIHNSTTGAEFKIYVLGQ